MKSRRKTTDTRLCDLRLCDRVIGPNEFKDIQRSSGDEDKGRGNRAGSTVVKFISPNVTWHSIPTKKPGVPVTLGYKRGAPLSCIADTLLVRGEQRSSSMGHSRQVNKRLRQGMCFGNLGTLTR